MNIRFSAVMRGSFTKLRGFPARFERLIGRDSSFIGLPFRLQRTFAVIYEAYTVI